MNKLIYSWNKTKLFSDISFVIIAWRAISARFKSIIIES